MMEAITALLLVLSMSVFVAHAFDAYRTTKKALAAPVGAARPRHSLLRLSNPKEQ